MPVLVPSTTVRTLGDLKTRIADELARADLTSQIALAISQAIEEACTHRFWFMETRGITLPLTAGTATYATSDIANLLEIDRAQILVGSIWINLNVANDDLVARAMQGTLPQGQPIAYSRFADQITFYPIPTQNYTVSIDGITKGATLASDSDSNIWTDAAKGERYIRALAKLQLYSEVIRDKDNALASAQLAETYREQLEALTHSRAATGTMESFGV